MSRPFSLCCLAAVLLAVVPSTTPAAEVGFLGRSLDNWVDDLKDPQPAVRRSAAFAVGKMGARGQYGLHELVRLLKEDEDASVRDAAAFAVGEVCGAVLREERKTAWGIVGEALLKALQEDKDMAVRASAAYAVGALGARGITAPGELAKARDALVRALASPDAGVRQNAAWALGQFGREAQPAVSRLIAVAEKDRDALVRRDAVAALGTIGSPEARPAAPLLVRSLSKDPDPVVRKTALIALMNVVSTEDKQVAAELIALLKSPDDDVVRTAALALGNIGGPEAASAVPVLRDLLREGDATHKKMAAAGLANIGADARPAVPDLAAVLDDAKSDTVLQQNACLALQMVGKDARAAVPQLRRALDARRPKEVRYHAAQALSHIMPEAEAAVPELIRALGEDPEWSVRVRAVEALGRLPNLSRTANVRDALVKVLAETDRGDGRMVRYQAAAYLAFHLQFDTPDKALDVLHELLKDENCGGFYRGTDTRVRREGSEGAGGDSQAKSRASGDFREQGATALAVVGPKVAEKRPEIVAELEKLAANATDPELKKASQDALKAIRRQ
jgi:HEAT repeat protein